MSDPLQRALQHMNVVFTELRRAQRTVEMNPTDVRRAILALSYTDSLGRTWHIDTRRSSDEARFMLTNDAAMSGDPGLDGLARAFRRIVAEHKGGQLSASAARERVLDLSCTDHLGRTWRIDTTRSGRAPRFFADVSPPDSEPPIGHDAHPTGEQPVLPAGTDEGDRARTAPPVASPPVTTRNRVARTGHRYRRRSGVVVSLALVVIAAVVVGLFVSSAFERSNAEGVTPGATSLGDTGPSTSQPLPAAGEQTASTPSTVPTFTTLNFSESLTIDDIPFETPLAFGTSVNGAPLPLERRGTNGGIRVLVVGVIHGDEQAGLAVVDLLHTMDLGQDIDLWLVRTMNPDGLAAGTRQNARGVDLNRNFSAGWASIGQLGYWQYSGPSPASEPETLAMMQLARMVQPDLVLWYHQDYFRIEPKGGREGQIRQRLAGLVGLPLLPISGGNYSGTANGWVRGVLNTGGVSITVEFGPTLREREAQANAEALLTIVREYFVGGGSVPLTLP